LGGASVPTLRSDGVSRVRGSALIIPSGDTRSEHGRAPASFDSL